MYFECGRNDMKKKNNKGKQANSVALIFYYLHSCKASEGSKKPSHLTVRAFVWAYNETFDPINYIPKYTRERFLEIFFSGNNLWKITCLTLEFH